MKLNLSRHQKILLLIICALSLLILTDFHNLRERNSLYCRFLDVSQGDACLLSVKGLNILIDSGPPRFKKSRKCKLSQRLDRMKVKKIDALFISHEHNDHSGGLAELINKYDLQQIFCSSYTYKYIADKTGENIEIITINAGDTVHLDEDFMLEVLNPPQDTPFNDPDNNSLVFKLTYQNRSILFTGDIFKDAERLLLKNYPQKIKADILKVPHHGSDTSSHRSFLKAVSPEYSVLSLGRNNQYGFPNPKVIKNLNKYSSSIYRTDQAGSMLFIIKNGRIIAPDNNLYI